MRQITLFLIGLLSLCILASCSHEVRTHGHYIDADDIALLEIGKTTKPQVRALLGSPSITDFFEDESWFYISQKNQKKVFEKDLILERRALQLTFNKKGILTTLRETDLSHQSTDFEFEERTTPTAGKAPSFFQQMVGNFGRFREKQEKLHSKSKKKF